MRIKRSSGALVCAALVAGCSGGVDTSLKNTPSSSISASATSLQGLYIPAARVTAPTETLAGMVQQYTLAWKSAAAEIQGFRPEAGAAELAEAETIQPFCTDKSLKFDNNGNTILYCTAAHEGPDPLPFTGMILVPFDTYQNAFGQGDPKTDNYGAALLVAMAYAQHVVAEARTGKLLAPPQIDRLARNLNCLAGITLRGAFRASLNDVQWQSTLDFARRFQVSGAPGWDLAQIRKGYGSGRLKDCM